jgi:hypothetical protein
MACPPPSFLAPATPQDSRAYRGQPRTGRWSCLGPRGNGSSRRGRSTPHALREPRRPEAAADLGLAARKRREAAARLVMNEIEWRVLLAELAEDVHADLCERTPLASASSR